MRVNNEQLAEQQMQTLETLRKLALHLASESSTRFTDNTIHLLRQLATWLEDRADRQRRHQQGGTKASLTRMRLFCLQLERLLEQLEHAPDPVTENWLCDECDELVANHQQRYLYEDMIACLKELSTLCIERGQGREAVLYNDMASRLETRLECGHIDLNDEEQRAKDEALYAEFQQKLKAMTP